MVVRYIPLVECEVRIDSQPRRIPALFPHMLRFPTHTPPRNQHSGMASPPKPWNGDGTCKIGRCGSTRLITIGRRSNVQSVLPHYLFGADLASVRIDLFAGCCEFLSLVRIAMGAARDFALVSVLILVVRMCCFGLASSR